VTTYTFGPELAYDATIGGMVKSATFLVYAVEDEDRTTPLVTRDATTGNVVPVVSNADGAVVPFQVEDHLEVMIVSGPYSAKLTAVKDIAAAAKAAKDDATIAKDAALEASAAASGVAGVAADAQARATNAEVTANGVAGTAADAMAVATTAESTVNTIKPRTGVKAVGQDEILINVRDYGAVGNQATDDTAAFLAAIAAAKATGKSSTVHVPAGNYRLSGTLTFDGPTVNLVGEGLQSSLVFFNDTATEYGLNFVAQSKFQLRNLSIRGNARTLIRIHDSALWHADGIVVYNSQSPVLAITNCIDWRFDNLDIQSGAGAGGEGPDNAIVYLASSSQGYLRYFHIEGPGDGVAVHYVNCADIRVHHGKIDGGNAGAGLVWKYLLLENSWNISVKDFSLVGFKNIPCELRGPSALFFEDTQFIQGPADALVLASSAQATVRPAGMVPGMVRQPMVSFRNVIVFAEAPNVTGPIKSLAKVTEPAPERSDGDFGPVPLRVVLEGAGTSADNLGGWLRRTVTHDNGSGGFVPIASNDLYNGYWMTHLVTGEQARVWHSITSGRVYLDRPNADNALFPAGDLYRMDRIKGPDVRVVLDKVRVKRNLRMTPTTFAPTFHVGEVAVSAAAYATFKTTVTLGAAAGAWVGYYLYKPSTDEYFLIREVAGSTLKLDFDVASKITAGTYYIRAGKPEGSFTWVE